jgi:hypothetical protein
MVEARRWHPDAGETPAADAREGQIIVGVARLP